MKVLTHVVFGAGTVVALAQGVPLELRLSMAYLLSLIVNPLIDVFGHTEHGGHPARSPLTHSVVTAPIWGGVAGYVVWAAITEVGVTGAGLESFLVVFGAVVAWAHLFLDSLTERGVYFITRRFALAHFGSGNMLVNAIFVLSGLVLLAL